MRAACSGCRNDPARRGGGKHRSERGRARIFDRAAIDAGGAMKPGEMNPLLRLAIDLGPLAVFFVAYARAGIMTATAAFMVATVLSLGLAYLLARRVPLMPLVTGAIVLVFGGLTLILADETFIKIKPTVIYGLFAIALLGGLAFNRPLLKPLFGIVMPLDEAGWRLLTLRWALFFVALALLNELVWRTTSTGTWVSFKVFGFAPLTILFAVAQFPLMRRHRLPEGEEPTGD